MGKVVVRRSDIFEVQLKGGGNLLHGKHPVLVLSCQVSNKFSDLIIVIPLTSTTGNNPSNILIGTECGLKHESTILTNQIQTISKNDILFKIGFVNIQKMQEIEKVLMEQLGIKNNWGDLKMSQVYEKARMEIRLAKCQENWNLLEELTNKYLKNLYKMNVIMQVPEINPEMGWIYFHLALVKKKNLKLNEAYLLTEKALTFSTQKNSDYYYSIWMMGSICMELGNDFALEGATYFQECINFYRKIGDVKYEICSIFNKAKIEKDILGMQNCIDIYRNTKCKPVLYYFGDMEKDEILEEMILDLKNIL